MDASPPLRTLLHVDDSDDELFLFRRALGKSGLPWQLSSVPGGVKALEHLREVQSGKLPQPNLLLLDLKMPVVNGFAVLDWLRTNLPTLRTVILSSSELPADRDRVASLGAAAYVVKSGSLSDLIELLREWPSQAALAQSDRH